MLPYSDPYPRGYENPIILRASAALPAAGAWDATPTETSVAGGENMTLSFTYTRGGAGGAFDWQLETSIYAVAANVPTDAAEWVTEYAHTQAVVAAGADTTDSVQRELHSYQATAAGAEDFFFGPIALEKNIERVRVRAKESGATGSPGTLSIVAEVV
jgi:hypothetical protein